MYEKVHTAAAPITVERGVQKLTHFRYNKMWDAVLGVSPGHWFRIFHDGSFARYGQPFLDRTTLISRVGGFPAFITTAGNIYVSNEVNGLQMSKVLNPDHLFTYTPYGAALQLIDDVNQLVVRWKDANSFEVRSLMDGTLVRTITHGKSFVPDKMDWAGTGIVCAFKFSTGFVCFIDYLGEQGVLETGSVGACYHAAYDSLCRTFWVYQTDYKVAMYVRSAIPSVLGNPIFIDATVRGLQAHQVKVRLTGSTGEPCVGWWIHWLLDDSGGIGPYGYLDKYISATDEDGYAWNTYYGPRDGELGQTVLKTWVEL